MSHTPSTNSVTLHLAAYTHKHTRSVPHPRRPDSVRGSRRATRRAPRARFPLAPYSECKFRPSGNPRGWPDLLPRLAPPHPHSGAGRPGIPGTSWTWQAAPTPPPRSSRALGPFAEGASLGRCLRPSSDHLASFSKPPGSPAHLGPTHLCSSHTWASSPPGPGCRPESCVRARPWDQEGTRAARAGAQPAGENDSHPFPPSYPREPRLLASVFQQWSETIPSSRKYSGLL